MECLNLAPFGYEYQDQDALWCPKRRLKPFKNTDKTPQGAPPGRLPRRPQDAPRRPQEARRHLDGLQEPPRLPPDLDFGKDFERSLMDFPKILEAFLDSFLGWFLVKNEGS